MLKKKPVAWLSLVLAFGLVAAACSDDKTSTDTTGTDNTVAPADCPSESGQVSVSGSSTVEPISSAVGEKLLDCGSGVEATVDGPGTGDGFVLFCEGQTDISDASRPIKDEEAQACADAGVDFIELKIGFDGISVLTNPANDTVECLSFADLYALIGPEATAQNWSDATDLATELGSSTVFPDAELDITGPGAESGTYDSFLEIAFKSIAEGRVEAGKITEDQIPTAREDYASQADDSAIIAAMEASDAPLGWVGFAFAEGAGDQVRELQVSKEPGGECIAPSAETIADASYPLSRSLYLYVNAAKATDNPAVAAYVDYYLSDSGLANVNEVGYVDLPADQIAATRATWDAKTIGTAAG